MVNLQLLSVLVEDIYEDRSNSQEIFFIKEYFNTLHQNNLTNAFFNSDITINEFNKVYLIELMVNEDLKTWFNDRVEKVSDYIKDKGIKLNKATTDFLQKIKDLGNFIKIIKETIINGITKLIDKLKTLIQKAFTNKEKQIIDKIKKFESAKIKTLKSEVKYIKEMFTYFLEKVLDLTKSFKDINKSEEEIQKIKLEEQIEEALYNRLNYIILTKDINFFKEYYKFYNNIINENTLDISLKFIKKILHTLGDMKPFVYFKELEHLIKENTNKFLNFISKIIANKLNGPGPYQFEVIGDIIGRLGEYQIKSIAQSNIFSLISGLGLSTLQVGILGSIPILPLIVNIFFNILLILYFAEIIEEYVVSKTEKENE